MGGVLLLSLPVLEQLKSFSSHIGKVHAAVTGREHFLDLPHGTNTLWWGQMHCHPHWLTFSISDLDLYGGWQSGTSEILKHANRV